MSFRDWVKNIRWTATNESSSKAIRTAGQELWQGFLRRGVGWTVSGSPIWDYDWDVLCILDGCRFDLMVEIMEADTYSWLPSTPDRITSVGGNSPEWLHETFSPSFDDEMQRTGYITANPFSDPPPHRYEKWPNLPLDESDFALLREVFKTEPQYEIGEGGSVAPDDVTKHAIHAWRNRNQYEVDKLVVHYMQPHAPFRSRPDWSEGIGDNPWNRLRDNTIHANELWEAYQDNLRWVLDSIGTLQRNVDADIVLSADHGNAMGEWGVYGHPPSTPVSTIRDVPWVPIDGSDENTYQPELEDPTQTEEKEVSEQLKALGYQ